MTLSLPEDEKITDTGLLALRDLPSLTDLNLARLSRFRYERSTPPRSPMPAFAFFEPLQKLESLTLSGNTITDAGLARIAKLPALRTLGLDATEITDAGLVYFGNMKNLETLDLGATRVTPAAVAKLRAARPDLIIILEADPEIEAGVKRGTRSQTMSSKTSSAPASPISAADTGSWTIRSARPDDAELLVNLVRELAVYEKLEHLAEATADDFRRCLFGSKPVAEAVIAEVGREPVGFALWFVSFSTFRGREGIYLEDLFVRPAYRGRGIGKGILTMLAQLAVDRGYARLEVVSP